MARSGYFEIPTRVGMDRVGPSLCRGPNRDPHARGDGPASVTTSPMKRERSPRAWGWTARDQRVGLGEDEIPTRVGMDRRASGAARSAWRDPHARGDGPRQPSTGCPPSSRSPRAWGWTVGRRAGPADVVEIPTRVGMDRP